MPPCKISKDCDGNQVCDNKLCRENKRDKPIEYYIEVCKKKNIPLTYENGKQKGEIKTKDALKRCLNQKSRRKTILPLKPKALSALSKLNMCKITKDCPEDQICDNKQCRPDKRIKGVEYYIQLCKNKGIPITYEVGIRQGQIKSVAALKRCLTQKKRNLKLPSKAKSI